MTLDASAVVEFVTVLVTDDASAVEVVTVFETVEASAFVTVEAVLVTVDARALDVLMVLDTVDANALDTVEAIMLVAIGNTAYRVGITGREGRAFETT